jgi:hypothetical protein
MLLVVVVKTAEPNTIDRMAIFSVRMVRETQTA